MYIYIRETRYDTFPLPFCKTGWVEDECAAERAIQLWENIVQIIKSWQSLSKSKQPQNNKSYGGLILYHLDSLIVAKLQFFR